MTINNDGCGPITVPKWKGPENQKQEAGDWTYDVAGVIFEARELTPFWLPLRHMTFDYPMGGPYVLDFVSHMRAVLSADLSKPIILSPEGFLIDGKHRVARAIHEGATHILAVRFDTEPESRRHNGD